MKDFFALAFLLACPLFVHGSQTPELFEQKKNTPNFDGVTRYTIKSHIVCPKNFENLASNKREFDFIYNGHDQRFQGGLSEGDAMLLAFIRSKNNKNITMLLDSWRIFKESDVEEAVEEIVLHIKDNKDINQKSIYVTREIKSKDIKEVCVEPVVCYWGKETKIKIPDVGKWANQYSLTIVPTYLKFSVKAVPEL